MVRKLDRATIDLVTVLAVASNDTVLYFIMLIGLPIILRLPH